MGSLIFETQTRVCSCSCFFFVCLFLCVFLPKPLSWPWDFCRNTRARTPEVEDCPTSIAHAPGEPRVEPPAKKRRPPAKESRAAGSAMHPEDSMLEALPLCSLLKLSWNRPEITRAQRFVGFAGMVSPSTHQRVVAPRCFQKRVMQWAAEHRPHLLLWLVRPGAKASGEIYSGAIGLLGTDTFQTIP